MEKLNLEEALAAARAARDVYSTTHGPGERVVVGHTQAMIRREPHRVLVAIAGTDDIRDMLKDAKIWRKDLGHGVRVHRGFWECYLTIRETLLRIAQERLRHHERVILAGHSLGAAMVCMALWRDRVVMPPNLATYLFGCPAGGNGRFVEAVENPNIWRFEHNNDFVVRALNPVYDHVGRRVYISRCGELLQEPGCWTVAMDRLAGRLGHVGRLGTDGFADHGSAKYVAALEKAAGASVSNSARVP